MATRCKISSRTRMAALALLPTSGLLGLALVAPSGAASPVQARTSPAATPRVGIVNAMGMEQAPILAAMKVTGSEVIDGYRFYLGTIGGRPVVEVRSGEKEYAAELATTLMDLHFHVVANLMSGTAGARNPAVNVGDVVVSGFVVDKSSIHFHARGFDSAYTGVEMELTGTSTTAGSVVGGYGAVGPTPANAASYGGGPSTTSKRYVYFEALAAPRALVTVATGEAKALGTTLRSDATGDASAKGSIPATVDVGVIGSANQWTEPLADQETQNALYESDAGENEGMGFAYANAQLGVPWLVVRGISDSPWYPNAYDGTLAADRAAEVASYVVGHLPAHVPTGGATTTMLSPQMNAVRAGYLVAKKVQLGPSGTPTSVQYVNTSGTTVTTPWRFGSEYQPSAGTAG